LSETREQTPLGSGLRPTLEQVADFGPTFAFEFDPPLGDVRDYSLARPGESVRLSATTESSPDRSIKAVDVVLGGLAGAGELVLDTALGFFTAGGTIVGAGLHQRLQPFGVELFSSHAENLDRALADTLDFFRNDPIGQIRLGLTDRFEAIDLAVQSGDGFQVGRLSANLAGEVGLAATGVGGVARGAVARLGRFGTPTGLLEASQRGLLLGRIREARTLTERKGIVFAVREADRLGFDLLDASLTYKGHQGIDLPFQNRITGNFATWEAKGGFTQRSLSSLSTDTRGFTQGSLNFIDTRLDRYLQFGDGTYNATALNLRHALASSQLESFASFYGSRRTYQLPLTGSTVRPAIPR